MEVRKREQQIRQDEKLARQSNGEKGEETVWYPLTEHATQGGDRKGEMRRSEKKIKEKGDTTNVKLEEKLDQRMDDKQLDEAKSKDAKLETKELPTKYFNKAVKTNDEKVTGKQEFAETQPVMSTDFHSHKVESSSIPAGPNPPSHDANPWTVRQKVQAEENRAIPN